MAKNPSPLIMKSKGLFVINGLPVLNSFLIDETFDPDPICVPILYLVLELDLDPAVVIVS